MDNRGWEGKEVLHTLASDVCVQYQPPGPLSGHVQTGTLIHRLVVDAEIQSHLIQLQHGNKHVEMRFPKILHLKILYLFNILVKRKIIMLNIFPINFIIQIQ